jgi:hypothetical protein
MSAMRRAALASAVLVVLALAPAVARAAAPVAAIDGPGAAQTGEGVGFDGAGSRDPDGGPLAFAWSIDGQDVGVEQDWLAVAFAYGGAHVVTLRVTDPDGDAGVARHTIEVRGRDRPTALPGAPLPPSVARVLTAEPRVDLLAPRRRRLRAGRLRIVVRCRGSARCSGVLKARSRLRRDGRRLLLGRRAFSLRAGTRAVVRVPVRPGLRSRLARHRHLRVRLTAFRGAYPLAGVWDSLRYRLRG